jgi:hypothetical protein
MTQPTLSEAPPQAEDFAQPDTTSTEEAMPPVEDESPPVDLAVEESDSQPDQPETSDAPETDAEQEPDQSDILSDPRFKKYLEGELAKKEESFRRTREAERKQAEEAATAQVFQQQRQQAAQWRQQQAGQAVLGMAQFVAQQVNEGKEVNEILPQVWQQFGGMAQLVDQAAAVTAMAPLETAFGQILKEDFPGYTPATEQAQSLWTAYHRQDLPGVMKAFAAMTRDAALKLSEPELRKKLLKEIEAEAKAEKQRAAEAERKAQPRPSGSNGTSAVTDIDAARAKLEDPMTGPEERKKLYKVVYGMDAP